MENYSTTKKQKATKENLYIQAKARVDIHTEQIIPRFMTSFVFAILIFYVLYVILNAASHFISVLYFLSTFPPWSFTLLSIICSVCVSFYFFWKNEKKIAQDYQTIHEYELQYPQNELIPEIIKTTDQYTELIFEDSKKGLAVVRVTLVGGIIIIMAGIIALFMKQTTSGCITCALGVITDIFSSLLWSKYKVDINSIHHLHEETNRSKNIYLALQIANSLPKDKQPEAKLAIINELVKNMNAQMMKSDADTDEPSKKDKPSDADTL